MNERVKFILLDVKTDQFASFEENLSVEGKVTINTNLSFRLNKEDKRIGIFTSFIFQQTNKIILKIGVSCHFGIAIESWEELLSDNSILLPKKFATHLAVLTVGTARGVLHSKTEDTPFNKYLLPIIDTSQLVEKDIEFMLTE